MELNANKSGVFFTNPILPGGYPDPSICRVGDTFYLVNSSFEYFPGLPLHQSKDLVNWECVGNALHREAQLDAGINLSDVQTKGGIHAASIRHHNGLFYIISTIHLNTILVHVLMVRAFKGVAAVFIAI